MNITFVFVFSRQDALVVHVSTEVLALLPTLLLDISVNVRQVIPDQIVK